MLQTKYTITLPKDLVEKKKKDGWGSVKETGRAGLYSMSKLLRDFKDEQQLEIKMRWLFKKLEFSDRVDGGQDDCEELNFNFDTPGTQIDAMGGVDKIFLVVDCTRSTKPENYIKNKIQHNDSVKKEIEQWLKEKYGNKYEEVIMAIGYENFNPTPSNRQEAAKKNIALIGFEFFNTCIEQTDILDNDSLKHQILKRVLAVLGKDKSLKFSEEPYEIPAMKGKAGGNTFYTFLMHPSELQKLAYVKRLHEEDDKGYQRHLKRKKINSINQFLYDADNCFYNNIIIWFNEKPEYDEDKKLLKIDKVYCSLEVIDGQHRLFGYNYTPKKVTESEEKNIKTLMLSRKNEDEIIITGFYSDDSQKRIHTFIDINNNQTRVPMESVLQQMSIIEPSKEDGVISKFILEKLNEQKSSKFYKSIKIKSEKRAHLTFTQVHRYAIKKARLFRNDLEWSLYRQCDGKADKPDKYPTDNDTLKPLFNAMFNQVNSYFKLISSQYRDDWENKDQGFTFSNNGVVILFRLYAHILKYFKFRGISITSDKATQQMKALLKGSLKEIIQENNRDASAEGTRDRLLKKIIKKIKSNKEFSEFPESLLKK